ncbi:hypothetical protein [Tahibacter caeni]|uniref:hypothetical protein n=1 Tax=Tahibacter caeni TaxID=1453545 RepID=UPI00214773D0|nr:hypothetical protein [Tahibacter caeni]
MARIVDLLTSTARASDHVTGTEIREGKIVGFSESVRDGRATVVDRKADGSLTYIFSGPTPTNETGTEEACGLLVQWWSRGGQQWTLVAVDPMPLHTDAVAESADGARVNIQVVRAMTANDFWHEADHEGQVSRQHSCSDLAELIRGSIAKKTRIPNEHRPGIVLVLNALDTSALAFPDVVHAFKAAHGEWVRSLGFAEVWVIGQASGGILRLD